jgi:nicotinamide mononucleotide (NMN) deamidase PncC
VGTVWVALDLRGRVDAQLLRLWGDREEIRARSAQAALELLRRALVRTSA